PSLQRGRGRRHVRRLSSARIRLARTGDDGAARRLAVGRVVGRGQFRSAAPQRSVRPGRRVPAVAPRTSGEVAANGRARMSRARPGAGVPPRGEARGRRDPTPPPPHPSGERPPALPRELIPRHVAVVMDGNGRWANARGLPRVEGHRAGEAALLEVVAGAIELGITHISAYAFSTENWKRSPDEVRFLMGFNREVLHRRRDQMDEWGVRVRWAGRRPRLWRSVISELERAEEQTRHNTVCTLTMCVNYGGRAEIADAAAALARDAVAGRIDPGRVSERTLARYLDEPE